MAGAQHGMAWARHGMCELTLMRAVCIRKPKVHNGQNQTAADIENVKQKNSSQILVFVKMLIQGPAVLKKCTNFIVSNSATSLFLNSQNKLLISRLFLSPTKVI
jgi:hypothetical protein